MQSEILEVKLTASLVLVWLAAAILLPIARVCGLIDWPWWIWAAPGVGLILTAGLFIISLGILGTIELPEPTEAEKQQKPEETKAA